ncbi:MAG: Hsp20 family protein [Clostridiales bacterium]|nr:Hsp20 family protein [Clostridiales bacterium]
MKLVPYRGLEVDKSFNEVFSMMDELFNNSLTQNERKTTFKLDVLDNDKEYIIEGELPGIQRENIHINFENNLLKISVEEKNEETIEEKNYIHRERKVVSMERVLKFKDINSDAIEAKLEHGILTVKLPKQEVIDTKKKIEIQ